MGNGVNGTSGSGNNFNAVFTDKGNSGVKVEDFLNMMVQQLSNQDFMNPVDDTQYLTQLAQFATMQQMQDLASYSKSNYVTSLLGKSVTAATTGMNGKIDAVTGPVEKISLVDNDYTIQVKGKSYRLEQIMEIHNVRNSGDSSVDTSNKTIAVSDITENSASFEWPIASTDDLVKDKVKYTVYISKDKAFDSVEDVEKNGQLVGDKNRTELTSETIKGLNSETKYYVNVVVTDENNVKSVYQKGVFETLKK